MDRETGERELIFMLQVFKQEIDKEIVFLFIWTLWRCNMTGPTENFKNKISPSADWLSFRQWQRLLICCRVQSVKSCWINIELQELLWAITSHHNQNQQRSAKNSVPNPQQSPKLRHMSLPTNHSIENQHSVVVSGLLFCIPRPL